MCPVGEEKQTEQLRFRFCPKTWGQSLRCLEEGGALVR